MTNNNSEYIFPAEWQSDGAILLAWPHASTDWAYMLEYVTDCYLRIVRALIDFQPVIILTPEPERIKALFNDKEFDRIRLIEMPTNDTWTRDYGPLTVIDAKSGQFETLDFCFNGWGMKFAACHDNLVTSKLHETGVTSALMHNHRDFVLEGGGIESDGRGAVMTTSLCQLSPNRNATLSKQDIERRLCSYFGAKKVLWVDYGYLAGDDTDSHIDTLARFAPNNAIVYVGCDNIDDEHFEELRNMKLQLSSFTDTDGRPYTLFELPLPDPIYDEDGFRLPATYANFLAMPQAVVMPTYGQPEKDRIAHEILEEAFNRPVVEVDCRALICQHGSLHCATMQMPRQILNH